MVPTYCAYISDYVRGKRFADRPAPGEHHFVSAYLVPKLFTMNGQVPDYINPDGTKAILGDVVYYKDEKHHFGIEVKLGVVRLTKKEFNEWLVGEDSNLWPNVFIGVGRNGIALQSWPQFRQAYIAAVKKKNPAWSPEAISEGYGPIKNVDELSTHLNSDSWFPLQTTSEKIAESESAFLAALRRELQAKNCVGLAREP
jgi:hypothetical protein